MKVALALENFHTTGGVEKRTHKLAEGLLSCGDEVHIITRRWADDSPASFTYHKAAVRTWVRAIKPVMFARSVASIARRVAPDILHSQTRLLDYDVTTLGVGCHQAFIDARTPAGAKPRFDTFDRVVLWLERKMLENLAGRWIITNSEMTRRHLAATYGVSTDRISVVYNGVDPEARDAVERSGVRERIRREYGISSEEIVILFVGTGFSRKGLDDLIRAVGRLDSASRAKARVVVVGSGHAEPYQEMAKEVGITLPPVFAGKRDDAIDFYLAADIYALPTLYDPFSNSTLEAMSAGLPVVTTNMNGVAEIITDGVSGFVAGSRSSESLSIALAPLVEDKTLRQTMGTAGQEVVSGFTWEKTATQTREVYQRLLEERR